MSVCIQTFLSIQYIYMYCIHAYIYACIHIYIHASFIHTYIYTLRFTHAEYWHTDSQTDTYVCLPTYICAYIYLSFLLEKYIISNNLFPQLLNLQIFQVSRISLLLEIQNFGNMAVSTFLTDNYLVTGSIFGHISTDPMDLFLLFCTCCVNMYQIGNWFPDWPWTHHKERLK